MFPKGLTDFAHKAAAQAATAAAAAGSGLRKAANEASKASSEALKHGKIAAQQAVSANPALAMVGQEVRIAGKQLFVESLLAEGGFAVVYLVSVVGSEGAEKYVLKKMFAGNPETIVQLTGEVKLMQTLSHPNIVRVFGADTRPIGREGVEIMVLMEFCPGGHLLARLNKQMETGRPLPGPKIIDVFLSVARPVAYMHALTPPTAHRDLKFENVLIASDGALRLCDFGSASTHCGVVEDKRDRADQEDAITRFTTPHFRSPEMVDLYSGTPLDARVDVWALGCMLYGLAYFKHPFQDSGPLGILSSKYRVPADAVPPPVATALRACLRFDPAERPTAAQLVTYLEAVKPIVAAAAPGAPAPAYPALHLSGGGSLPTAAYPPGEVNGAAPLATLMASAHVSPSAAAAAAAPVMTPASSSAHPASSSTAGSAGFFDAGSAGGSSGFGGAAATGADSHLATDSARRSASSIASNASSSASPQAGGNGYNRPTAAEIAAKIASAPAPASGALAARMARRGAASTGTTVAAPSGGHVAVPSASVAPAAARVRAPSGDVTASDFDVAPAQSRGGHGHSVSAVSSGGVSSAADFADFDAFGSSDDGFGGSAASPVQHHHSQSEPSPPPVTQRVPAATLGASDLDDFFSSGPTNGGGGGAGGAGAAFDMLGVGGALPAVPPRSSPSASSSSTSGSVRRPSPDAPGAGAAAADDFFAGAWGSAPSTSPATTGSVLAPRAGSTTSGAAEFADFGF